MCLLLFFRFAEVIAALRRDERIRPAGGGGRFHTISFLLAQKRNGYSAFCRGAFTRPDVKWCPKEKGQFINGGPIQYVRRTTLKG